MTWLNKHFDRIGIAFIVFMLAMHVIALRDAPTVNAAIDLSGSVMKLIGETQ